MTQNWTNADHAAHAKLMAQIARTSPDRRAEQMRAARIPEAEVELAHAEAVAEQVWRARGIDVTVWRCPRCEAPYTSSAPPIDNGPKSGRRTTPRPPRRGSYPREACTCGRPYPARCTSRGCAQVVQPAQVITASDRLYDTPNRAGPLWELPADRRCGPCSSDAHYRSRLRVWTDSAIAPHVRAVVEAGYSTEARENVHEAINGWLNNDLGRSIGVCSLYLWGLPGYGKTLGVAWATYEALVVRGLVASVFWTTQSQLRVWHDQSWQHDSDRARALAEQGTDAWRRAREAPLLVIDETFSAPCRGAFAERLADLVRDRLDQRMPTLHTSNHPPQWSVLLETDGRIDSRWSASGRTVEVGGRDWRQG